VVRHACAGHGDQGAFPSLWTYLHTRMHNTHTQAHTQALHRSAPHRSAHILSGESPVIPLVSHRRSVSSLNCTVGMAAMPTDSVVGAGDIPTDGVHSCRRMDRDTGFVMQCRETACVVPAPCLHKDTCGDDGDTRSIKAVPGGDTPRVWLQCITQLAPPCAPVCHGVHIHAHMHCTLLALGMLQEDTVSLSCATLPADMAVHPALQWMVPVLQHAAAAVQCARRAWQAKATQDALQDVLIPPECYLHVHTLVHTPSVAQRHPIQTVPKQDSDIPVLGCMWVPSQACTVDTPKTAAASASTTMSAAKRVASPCVCNACATPLSNEAQDTQWTTVGRWSTRL